MDQHQHIITTDAAETAAVGQALGSACLKSLVKGSPDGQRVYCLYGELGSGKTTFTQGFARGLGLTARLLSPTFIIVRRYDLNTGYFFYHVDLYRMSADSEIKQLGIEELLTDSHAVLVIEWAEKLGALLPGGRTDISFSVLPDGQHRIQIARNG